MNPNDVVEIVVGGIDDRAGDGLPGVVHQDVEAAPRSKREVDEIFGICCAPDIAAVSHGRPVRAHDLLDDGLCRILAAIVDYDVCSLQQRDPSPGPAQFRVPRP